MDDTEELLRAIKELTYTMGGDIVNRNRAMSDDIAALNRSTRAREDDNAIVKAGIQARKEEAEYIAQQKASLKQAGNQSIAALKGFNAAMQETTPGFSKFSYSISSAGNAAASVASAFGPLGKAIGFGIETITKFTGAILKQTDVIISSYQEIAKVGGSVGLTAEGLKELGREAGFNVNKLQLFTKHATESSAALVAMGGTVSGGMKKFSEFNTVSEDARKTMFRMGLTQEDLIAQGSIYLRQQVASGATMSKIPKDIQKAALEYIDSLQKMADLTGISAQKQQDNIAAMTAMEGLNQYLYRRGLEQRDLEKASKTATGPEKERIDQELLEIKNEIAVKQKAMKLIGSWDDVEKAAMAQGMSRKKGESMVATEAIGKVEGMQGRKVRELTDRMNDGTDWDPTLDLLADQRKGLERYTRAMGRTAEIAGVGSDAAFGVGNKTRESVVTNQQKDLDTPEGLAREKAAQAEREEKRKREAEKSGTKGQAPMDAGATLQEWQIKYNKLFDSLIDTLNPFTGSMLAGTAAMVALGGAATLAALALGRLGGLGGLLSKIPGLNKIPGLGGGPGAGGGPGPIGGGPSGKTPTKPGGFAPGQFGGQNRYPDGGVAEAGKKGGWLGKMAGAAGKVPWGTLGKGLGIGAVGSIAADYGSDKLAEHGHKKSAAALGIGGTAAGWAGTGALLGSVVPGLGTGIGAGVGAAAGGAYGLYKNWGNLFGGSSQEKEKEKEATKEEIESKEESKEKTDAFKTSVSSTTTALDSLRGSFNMFNAEIKTAYIDIKRIRESGKDVSVSTGGGGAADTGKKKFYADETQRQSSTPSTPSTGQKPLGKFSGFGDDVDSSIKQASAKYGMDEKTLRGFIKMEGGWTGKMSPTGAIGTGQFIQSTWDSLAKSREGKEIGMRSIGKDFRTSNDPRFDKHTNTMATALLAKQNADLLKQAGLEATGENLYMLHNIGPGVIPALKGGQVNSATMLAMRQNGMRPGQTAAEFANMQKGKFNSHFAAANDKSIPGAAKGGILSGPKSGYPAILHGTEIVSPLNPNSILKQLATTPAAKPSSAEAANTVTAQDSSMQDLLSVQQDMISMMTDKLDNIISALGTGNDIQDQLLKYSRV